MAEDMLENDGAMGKKSKSSTLLRCVSTRWCNEMGRVLAREKEFCRYKCTLGIIPNNLMHELHEREVLVGVSAVGEWTTRFLPQFTYPLYIILC